MKINIYFTFWLVLLFASLCLKAQIVVNSSVNSSQLISSLVGSGISVSNISLNCNSGAYGTFTASSIGINNGIILTTGSANVSGSSSYTNDISYYDFYADIDLSSIEPYAYSDPCILEFDFIPQCNSLTIQFLFGSEEYPEYIFASYNDAFGFFITGPNPLGGNYSSYNLATLPNSNPVSVDNINDYLNTSYYVDNTFGNSIVYDGYTSVISKTISLVPCSTYHFKIIIADAGDEYLDSGVLIDFLSCTQSISSIASTVNSSCGNCNGQATINVSNALSALSFNWNPNVSSKSSANNLCPGTYNVYINETYSCIKDTVIFTISENTIPINITTSNVNSFCGNSNGSATATVSGGTAPYSYSWSNGASTSSATALAAGSYTVTVTDANGCTATASVTINNNSSPSVSATATNTTCGNSNGSANATVIGGTAPYTYSWSNGASTSSATALAAGFYTVTVTDANGCTATASVTINNTSGPSVSATAINASCGNSNGSATATVSGGTAPYSYTWSNGASTSSATALAAGSYTVTVTDANGCTATASVTVNNTIGSSISATAINASCGNSNGSATATVSGGTAPYSYSWSNGASTSSATALAAGSYTVTVSDANGCTATASVNINDIGGATLSTTSTDATCGNNNGSAIVTVTGGTLPYTYLWSDGQTTAGAINLGNGSYTVTVTDASSCTVTATVNINDLGGATFTTTSTDATCGNNNGSAIVTVTGGTLPYTYLWSDGQTTAGAINLGNGSYTVTVTDASSCTVTATVNINDLGGATFTTTSTDATCGNNNGSATVTVTGGTSPYTYLWSDGQTTATASNLSSGNYSVTVTDDNGCTTTASININDIGGVTLTTTSTDATCGNNNGSATITAIGGTLPYTYLWSDGQTTATASNLVSGNYPVTVTDANGCTATATVNINDLGGSTLTTTSTDATCGNNNGSAIVTVTGGTLPYTYLWSDGQTTATASNLSSGNYSVTVTDDNGCTTTASININDIGGVTLTTTSTDATCGNKNGSATITAIGGTLPYTYLWSDGQTTATASNLVSGNYPVTVTDANGCTATATVNINDLGGATFTTTSTDATCGNNNGSATVTAIGGILPYTYLWSDGQTTATASNLVSGNYPVTVTDANGCTATATVNINDLGGATLTTTSTDAACGNKNGSATVTATGGTLPYTYLWSDGQTTATASNLVSGNYSVEVSDANGCTATATVNINDLGGATLTTTSTDATCGNNNGSATVTTIGGILPYTYLWSDGQTTATASNLVSGNYPVTVTDANGCTATATVNINDLGGATLTTTSTDAACGNKNGSATVTATGGTLPYTYLWSDGQTTATASNLSSGNYSVEVSDANGCTATATVNINDIGGATLTTTSTDATCGNNNGSAIVTVTGGTLPYTYLWSDGQTAPAATNLGSGSYTVTVTDASSCTVTATVNINDLGGSTLTTTSTDATCGNNNGSATVTVTGGTPPYTYLWSDGQTTATASNLSSGNYSVTVTDDNGCTTTASININYIGGVTLTTTSTDATCGNKNGSATITAIGGTLPYTYLWSDGQTTATASNLSSGNYSVTVTDDNGCTTTASININDIGGVTLTTTSTDATCGNKNGSATVTAIGGTLPYTYLWSDGQTTAGAINLGNGSYTVTVTDANACVSASSVLINDIGTISATVDPTDEICNLNNGTATVNIVGGYAPYSYSWSNAANTQSISNLAAGNYSVTVINSLGCLVVVSTTVNGTLSLVSSNFNFLAESYSFDLGMKINFFETSVNATQYYWDFGDGYFSTVTDPSHVYSDTGIYNITLIVTDQFGCTDTIMKTLLVESFFSATIPNSFSPNGDGKNDIFNVQGLGILELQLNIYNRWGRLIYTTADLNKGWDGKVNETLVQEDVFTYKIIIKDIFKMQHQYIGKVNLIR